MELNYEYITTNDGMDRVLSWLNDHRAFALDSEQNGLNVFRNRTILVQLGNEEKQWIIDARVASIKRLGDVMLSSDHIKLGQNIRHDVQNLSHHFGLKFRKVICTMIGEQLIRSGLHVRASMEALAERYLGLAIDKSDDLRMSFGSTPVNEFSKRQLDYAAKDVVLPIHIFRHQKTLIKERGLISTFNLENDFIPVLAEMELAGMKLDVNAWVGLYQEASKSIIEAENVIDTFFGIKAYRQGSLFDNEEVIRAINYNSPTQLKNALDKKGFVLPNTNATTMALAAIEGQFPKELAQAILDYRSFQVSKSRYGLNFLDAIEPSTDRVHTSFSQCFTDTGRLSSGQTTLSSDDGDSKRVNLQNIPGDQRYRSCFIPKPGYVYIIYDYQAIEPRILGEISGDPTYLEAFNTNKDIYGLVGSKIYGEEVSKAKGRPRELRDKTKIVVLGNSYGTGKEKFHRKLLVDFNTVEDRLRDEIIYINREESDLLYDKFFETCPKIRACLDELSALASPLQSERRVYDDVAAKENFDETYAKVIKAMTRPNDWNTIELMDRARKTTNRRGYITYAQTLGGRKRFFKVYHTTWWTEGRNSPIQMGAATILKRGMVDLHQKIASEGHDATIINQVHDEIIVECRKDHAEAVNAYTKPILENAGLQYFTRVPCKVEGGIKDRWLKD